VSRTAVTPHGGATEEPATKGRTGRAVGPSFTSVSAPSIVPSRPLGVPSPGWLAATGLIGTAVEGRGCRTGRRPGSTYLGRIRPQKRASRVRSIPSVAGHGFNGRFHPSARPASLGSSARTEHPSQVSRTPEGTETPANRERRRAQLAQAVAREVAGGTRVESNSDYLALLFFGKPVNHVLHLILTLVTFLLWAIVWIWVAVAGGEKRVILPGDDHGNVLCQEAG